MPHLSAHLLVAALQLCVLNHVHGGAYYGHKQNPQQHQPLPQLPHLPLGNDGQPQQPYLGKEMPHAPYGKEMPIMPQYRKELPQLPYMGKERQPTEGKGETCVLSIVVKKWTI